MHISALLRKGLQFVANHRGVVLFALFISVASAAAFCGVHVAHAQDTTLAQTAGSALENPTDTGAIILTFLLNALTYLLNLLVTALGKLTILIIEILIIPILNYNSFSSSPIIGLGWSLVRDVMNMFVIVALIFIAIFTIAGNHRAHWEQQLPQLFIAVVFMNFSRTICGILIDISQVIMFTFVNALLDIAAGNFAQLLSLQDFGKYNLDSINLALQNGTSAAEPFKQFIEAFLQVPLYMAIFAILFLLALAFLYRIVILWVLVILSPAAFFLRGIQGVFHGGPSPDQWWSRFTGALLMGPILAFFLWLALAAASGGSIAESESFPLPESPDTFFSIQALDASHVTSLLLALILLMVGMEIAGEQSSRVGGIAADVISKGMGRRVVSGAVTLPFTAGASAASYAGRTADVYLAPSGSGTVREAVGKGIIGAGQRVAELGQGTPLQGLTLAAGRTVASAGGALELQGEHERAGRRKAAQDRVAAMSDSEKAMHLATLEMGQQSAILSTKEDYDAANLGFIQSGQTRNETKEYLEHNMKGKSSAEIQEAFLDTVGKAIKTGNEEKSKGRLDDKQKGALKDLSNEYFDRLEKPSDWVDGADFDLRKSEKRAGEIMNSAAGADIRKAFDSKIVTFGGKEMSMREAIQNGSYGKKWKDALAKFSSETDVLDKDKLLASGSVETMRTGFDKGNGDVMLRNMELKDLQGSRGRAAAEAIAKSKVDINALGANQQDPAVRDQMVERFAASVFTEQKADTIRSAFENAKVTPTELKADHFTASSTAQQVELVRGVVGGNANLSFASKDTVDAFQQTVDDLRSKNLLTPKETARAQTMLLGSGRTLKEVLPNVNLDPQTQAFSSDDTARLSQILKESVENARHLAPAVDTATAPNAATKVIVENTKSGDFEKLAERIENAKGAERAELRKTAETIAKAVSLQRSVPPWAPGVTPSKKQQENFDRLEALHDQIETTMRTLP